MNQEIIIKKPKKTIRTCTSSKGFNGSKLPQALACFERLFAEHGPHVWHSKEWVDGDGFPGSFWWSSMEYPDTWRCTLPETNSSPLKMVPPKRKRSSSNHPFSGAMLVSGRVFCGKCSFLFDGTGGYLLILRQSETSSNMILGRAFGLLVVGICLDMHIVGIEESRFQQMTEDVNKNWIANSRTSLCHCFFKTYC